jgi:STE24 endopeptidase
MHRPMLVFVALLFLVPLALPGQTTPSPGTPTATPAPTPPPAAVLSPDNPEAFDAAKATTAWLDTVPADKREKSDAYFEGGYWLLLWDFLISAAILIILLQTGISARLRDFAENLTSFKALQVIAYAVPFIVIVSLATFPMAIYEGFVREHQYGLSTQTFGPWFKEQLITFALTLIFAPLALVILYAVFRRAPRTWWIWATIVAVCFQIFASFFAPVYIMPLYNKYTPLQDSTLRDPILAMARANEIPVKQVLVVDASKQSNRVSANVAGLFGTTRIALNDNLLKQCSLPEIRAVMAHEMGHYVLNHNVKMVTSQSLLNLILFAVTAYLFNRAVNRWGARWRVRGIGDPAGLPLLAVILSVLSLLFTPAINTAIRTSEREADAFGLNTSREPDGMAMVALKLGTYRKLDPKPLEEAIFFDHPSGRSRIRMAMDWKAAQLTCGGAKR